MCNIELKDLLDTLKEQADELYRFHNDENIICEVCLVRMQAIINELKFEKSKEPK